MGSNSSSSSASSATPNDTDCYLHNQMMRQQCLRTRPDNNGYTLSKPYSDNNYNGINRPPAQQPINSTGKTQLGCDCQGNVVECDENGQIIRVIKSNNR